MKSENTDPAADPPECFLRILSGPHLGACVPLPQGDYVLGSGLGADFLITDESIADAHALIRVTQGSVELMSGTHGGTTYLNGEPIGESSAQLLPEIVFTVGTTHFTLTESGKGEAPRLELPTLIHGKDEDPEATEDDTTDSAEGHDDSISEMLADGDAPKNERKKKSKGGCFLGGLVALIVLALIAANLLGFFDVEPKEKPDTGPQLTIEEQIQKVLVEQFPDEKAISLTPPDERGSYGVEGTVSSTAAKAEISREIRKIDPRAKVKLKSLTTVISAIRAYLDQNGAPDVEMKLNTEGRLVLNGEATSSEAIEIIVEALPKEFDQVSSIDAEMVWNRKDLVATLLRETEMVGMQDTLAYSLDGDAIVIEGDLVEQDREAFVGLKRNLEKETGKFFKLKDEVKFFKVESNGEMTEVVFTPVEDASETSQPAGAPKTGVAVVSKTPKNQSPAPPKVNRSVTADLAMIKEEEIQIKEFKNVTVGAISWLITKDGEKLMAGAKLPSGYIISEITQESVRLTRDDAEKIINLK